MDQLANAFIATSRFHGVGGLRKTSHLAIDSTDHATSARIRVSSSVKPGPENDAEEAPPIRLVDNDGNADYYTDPRSGRTYPYLVGKRAQTAYSRPRRD